MSFTTPAVRVNEDVPSGSTQVCLIADSASPRPYTVVVGRRPSGDNPATRKLLRLTVRHIERFPCFKRRNMDGNEVDFNLIHK